jgi:hypothetical protein
VVGAVEELTAGCRKRARNHTAPARAIPLEMKTVRRVGGAAEARGLESFLDEYTDRTEGGLGLSAGKETFPLTRRVLAVPGWRIY